MMESNTEFRAQFDRSHPSYHGSGGIDDTRIVPCNMFQKKIPEGMMGEAPFAQKQLDDSVYGEKFLEFKSRRDALGDLKKIVGQLCPPIERMLKIFATIERKGKASDAMEMKLDELRDRKSEIISKIEETDPMLIDESTQRELQNILKKAEGEFDSRVQYGEFVQQVRRFTQGIFKQQGVLLNKMKDTKRSKSASVSKMEE